MVDCLGIRHQIINERKISQMRLMICGDLVPTNSNEEYFIEGRIKELIGQELYDEFLKIDGSILNLEVPLSDENTPIKKCGPNLLAKIDTIKGIKQLKPTVISLANNHIYDHGNKGLNSTIEVLKQYNIPYIGAGDNILHASKPYIIQSDNIKIGVYSCCQTEFGIATNRVSGANAFDPLESLDHIKKLKLKCDYVIVLYHGGKEHYRYPTPYLQKVCRKMTEKGADLVVCQHSHCIGARELYNGSNIIYGQGNFLFDGQDNEFWNSSLLIKLYFGDNVELSFIPIIKDKNRIRIANINEKKKILREFDRRSEEIKNDVFIENEFNKFIKERKRYYLTSLGGFGRIMRKINFISKDRIVKMIYNENDVLKIRNHIESEDHREILLEILKDILK